MTRSDLPDLDFADPSPAAATSDPLDRRGPATSPTPDHTRDKRPGLHGYGGVLAVLLALLGVGATVVAPSSEVRHQVAISFVPQSEKYTELYFFEDGPTEGRRVRNRVVVNVPFTVANHEGHTTHFPYVVQVVNGEGKPVGRFGGSEDIADGNSLTTIVAVVIPATEAWAAVDVDLEGRSERIHFLASHMKATGG